MSSCLGIYIEDKLIKYAKVSKERENIKVEAFDIKFYEDLEQTLNQIIQETNSQKTPIAINVSEEMYNYFEVFSLLSTSDMKKSMDIEFEVLCTEKGYNKDLLETRHVLLPNTENLDKLKVINVAVNKSELNDRIGKLEKNKLVSARPLPTSILNLVPDNKNSNSIVVNIEDRTYMTIIEKGNLSRVSIIPEGMNDILEKINERENSYSKAYEICKNTTISRQGLNIEEGNEYIDLIIPTLYTIVSEIKKEIAKIDGEISKIYITGSGISINNLDLYFQDFLDDIPCEILKPKFLEAGSLKIGIKEYIEVNSAIALALDGLGTGIKELNFVVPKLLSLGISSQSTAGNKIVGKGKISMNMKGEMDPAEKLMVRLIATAGIFVIGYGLISGSIMKRLDGNISEAKKEYSNTVNAISQVDSDQEIVEYMTDEYVKQIEKMKGGTSNVSTTSTTLPKDAIPNFLNQVMFLIPQNVVIESIENTSGTHISIETKSKEYQQIGLFKAILYNKELLENVTSTGSIKEGDYVKVTIEGDLP